eukprot:snap_masked-scaffold_3-processed-gene-5.17-mRNA-1 protein AED:0.47 eAED:0.51 QI:0/0/0/0.2/1/1/5/0/1044
MTLIRKTPFKETKTILNNLPRRKSTSTKNQAMQAISTYEIGSSLAAFSPVQSIRGQLATISHHQQSSILKLINLVQDEYTSSSVLSEATIKGTKVTALSWGKTSNLAAGNIACTLVGLQVDLINPKKELSQVTSLQKTSQKVLNVDFSPAGKNTSLLAFGTSNNELHIADLKTLKAVNTFSLNSAEKTVPGKHLQNTDVVWNSQVVHIVGAASSSGLISVWDLREKKPWCRFSPVTGSSVSSIQWNPQQGLHLLTAVHDSLKPKIYLWDLRKQAKGPMVAFSGHSKPVEKLAWCKHDPLLFASAGNDNEFLIWDIHSNQIIENVGQEIVAKPHSNSIVTEDDPFEFTGNEAGDIFNQTAQSETDQGSQETQANKPKVLFSSAWRGVLLFLDESGEAKTYSYGQLCARRADEVKVPRWKNLYSGAHFSFGDKISSMEILSKAGKVLQRKIKISSHLDSDSVINKCVAIDEGATVFYSETKDEEAIQEVLSSQENRSVPWEILPLISQSLNHGDVNDVLTKMGFNRALVQQAYRSFVEEGSTEHVGELDKMIKFALLCKDIEAASDLLLKREDFASAMALSSVEEDETFGEVLNAYFGSSKFWSKTYSLPLLLAANGDPGADFVNHLTHFTFPELVQVFFEYSESDEEFSTWISHLLQANFKIKPENLIMTCLIGKKFSAAILKVFAQCQANSVREKVFLVYTFVSFLKLMLTEETKIPLLQDPVYQGILYAVTSMLCSSGQVEYAASYLSEVLSIEPLQDVLKVLVDRLVFSSSAEFPSIVDYLPNGGSVLSKQIVQPLNVYEEENFLESKEDMAEEVPSQLPTEDINEPTSWGEGFQTTSQPAHLSPQRSSPRIPVNDGFGTTAGNHAAGRKYGNHTKPIPNTFVPAAAAPAFQQEQVRFNGNASSGADVHKVVPPHPPGTLSQTLNQPKPRPLNEEEKSVLEVFRSLTEALRSMEGLTSSQSRCIKLGDEAIIKLEGSIGSGKVPAPVLSDLLRLSDALSNYDFEVVKQIRLSMTRNFWGSQKLWLKDLAQLLNLAQHAYAET